MKFGVGSKRNALFASVLAQILWPSLTHALLLWCIFYMLLIFFNFFVTICNRRLRCPKGHLAITTRQMAG